MKSLLLLSYLAFCSLNKSHAQNDSAYAMEVYYYIKYVDSLIESERYLPIHVIESISEGPISMTKTGRGKINSEKLEGGFSRYIVRNLNGDTTYRINKNDNLQKYLVKLFYYRNNKPIYALIKLEDWEKGIKIIYQREEFYKDGKILHFKETGAIPKKLRWRVPQNFLLASTKALKAK